MCLLAGLILVCSYLHAQVNLTLSLDEFMAWKPGTNQQANVSNTPLARRAKYPNHQLFDGLDTNARVLYSPDGMNNFGPYIDSSDKFNSFNFSHWQYIDMLAWFGGTASIPVMLPSKPWVDAAHKNGVEVIGCVFFAPQAWGGAEKILIDFLEKDPDTDEFMAVKQLTSMAEYFHFDGWLLNFETNVSTKTGELSQEFVKALKDAYSGEIIWYDAMLPSGRVVWQNELNGNNGYFFENTSGIFTNYWWNGAMVKNSNGYAKGVDRSAYDVYTGADMWPNRTAQRAFNNYTWIDQIYQNNVAQTSVALFGTNFNFNYEPYSNFRYNPNDVEPFYSYERKIFSGIDEDPSIKDAKWKGMASYTPVRTIYKSLPIETDFNTGHGLAYYQKGQLVREDDWHNMSFQSNLPSWTFIKGELDTVDYRFDDAYNGGSHLYINSSSKGEHELPLFSTVVFPEYTHTQVELGLKTSTPDAIDSISFFINGTRGKASASATPDGTEWKLYSLKSMRTGDMGRALSMGIRIHANAAFDLKVGHIKVDNNGNISTRKSEVKTALISIFPNPSHGRFQCQLGPSLDSGSLRIFNLDGQLVIEQVVKSGMQEFALPSGIYFYEFYAKEEFTTGKMIID